MLHVGIKGGTSGIGAETARVLAKRGVRVVIPARDLIRAAEVKDGILRENPKAELIVLEIDLSSFASVKRFCSEFLALGLPLNILMWDYYYYYYLNLISLSGLLFFLFCWLEKENNKIPFFILQK